MSENKHESVLTQLSNDLTAAVDVISPAVLTVRARRRMPASGVAWTVDGLIVSASHVVEQDEDISICLPDGECVGAVLVGRDPSNDLALLRLAGGSITPAVRAAADPEPGNLVMAVGRPGHGGVAASFGIISAVGKPGQARQGRRREEFIKADVSMLPGFSGGPLITTSGQLLGMNSSTLWRNSGLTVPHAVIERSVKLLLNDGKVRRGFLGVGAQAIDLGDRLVNDLALNQRSGLLVINVENGGPADDAGYVPGDIILSVNSEPVDTVEGLQNALSDDLVGKPAAVELIRGGQLLTTEPIVAERRQAE